MSALATWPAHIEDWLDERGTFTIIVLMILGFIIFWPLGLAMVAYLVWSKCMTKNSALIAPGRAAKTRSCRSRHAFKSSGNSAFDTYKADTLRRLEQEQKDFEHFLHNLYEAKDKAEFDQFMATREAKTSGTEPSK